ncbi:Oidioi.mRNA.OKI2018_I69.chr2.g7121.t1.cds [Oikopleura dioica]|uniref:Oidioi.mRNA.OKI2018_I69.chr2.g7121.t1.cds n=1 Tax=Oikopleura dioica TaxID=34765 RepID=A0ABN7T7H7_OIKDI|nr:Oidioi.mRNA.OKI2018_I69.chr2.g7121.t1.cds [Oikopleura dioica]
MGEFTIRVKTLDGQTNEVTLVDTSTVLQLKELIEKKTQIAKNRQKIIYRGRVLTDNLLLKDQADINGSAVHVVDSNRVVNSRADQTRQQPNGSGSSRSRNSDRPRGRERYRTSHRTSAAREGLRSRLYSMETWLARFEGSLTALDRGATPEDSRQFANEPDPPNPAEMNNPIPVTDLASIVNRAADSIERFPAALRRLHTFISDDPNQAGLLGSLMAFEGPAGGSQGDESMTGSSADATSIFTNPPQLLISEQIPFPTQGVSQLAQQRLAEQFNRFRASMPDPIIPVVGVNSAAPASGGPPAAPAPTPAAAPPPASEQTQQQQQPSAAAPNNQATTANINITASITPNVQINIRLPRESSRARPSGAASRRVVPRNEANGTSTAAPAASNGSEGNRTSTAAPPPPPVMPDHLSSMLPRDILNEITRSVNRFNSSGDPVVIESMGQPNQEVGRIVGEAVFQTLQNLYSSDQRPGTSSIEVLASRMPPQHSARGESQPMQWNQPTQLPVDTPPVNLSNGSFGSNPPRRTRQAPRQAPSPPDFDSFQFTAKNNETLMGFLFGEVEDSCRKTGMSGEEASLWDKIVQHVQIFKLPLKAALDLFANKSSCRKEFKDLVSLIKSNKDHVTAAFKAFIERIFANEAPIAEANILESNLR